MFDSRSGIVIASLWIKKASSNAVTNQERELTFELMKKFNVSTHAHLFEMCQVFVNVHTDLIFFIVSDTLLSHMFPEHTKRCEISSSTHTFFFYIVLLTHTHSQSYLTQLVIFIVHVICYTTTRRQSTTCTTTTTTSTTITTTTTVYYYYTTTTTTTHSLQEGKFFSVDYTSPVSSSTNQVTNSSQLDFCMIPSFSTNKLIISLIFHSITYG